MKRMKESFNFQWANQRHGSEAPPPSGTDKTPSDQTRTGSSFDR